MPTDPKERITPELLDTKEEGPPAALKISPGALANTILNDQYGPLSAFFGVRTYRALNAPV